MPTRVRLDHAVIPAADPEVAAAFLADLLGLAPPEPAGPFLQVALSDGLWLDFAPAPPDFPGLHLAFHVDDATFDRALARIHADGIEHWADPRQTRPGEHNTNHGGRGVYLQGPTEHYLELLTARYDGSRLQ